MQKGLNPEYLKFDFKKWGMLWIQTIRRQQSPNIIKAKML